MPSIAHISLTFVGLMWVLPFLYYYHSYPLTTFYQEWGAAILGLSAMPLLVTKRYWLQPEIPLIVLLPIGLLLLGMMQFVLGRVGYFDQILLLALYSLWAALLNDARSTPARGIRFACIGDSVGYISAGGG